MTVPCKGFYDIHLHPGPDVSQRKFSDEEVAERLSKKEFSGFVLKIIFLRLPAGRRFSNPDIRPCSLLAGLS